jgi:hypothetical protein
MRILLHAMLYLILPIRTFDIRKKNSDVWIAFVYIVYLIWPAAGFPMIVVYPYLELPDFTIEKTYY